MEIVKFVKPVKVSVNEYREDLANLAASTEEDAAGKFVFPTAERSTHVRKIQKGANEIDKTATIQDEQTSGKDGVTTTIIVTLGKKHAQRGGIRKGGTVDTGADSADSPTAE